MSTRDEDEDDGTGPEPSYIDYETFLAPDFRPASFANGLVLATNNAGDLPLDLSTPLSRVLFDAQEVDSHIETLTAREAVPLLEHTRSQTEASARIVAGLDGPIRALNESYAQLEKKVTDKYAEADEVRRVATRLWETLRLSTAAARCLALGRQLEVQHAEAGGSGSTPSMTAMPKKEDHRALVRCAHTIISLREILDRTEPGQEGHGLNRVEAIRSLREGVVAPTETAVRDAARRLVREFAVSATATFSQSEETRARVVSGLMTLYLLSPVAVGTDPDKWTPKLLLEALEEYVRSALQASIRELARALGQLPTLDRALVDVEARCQNVVALEAVLDATRAPEHPLLPAPASSSSVTSHKPGNLLQPLLGYLETGSLASYFWRSMASSLATRVAELVGKGGAPARTLRTNRAAVGEAVRGCVLRGCRTPGAVAELGGKVRAGRAEGGNWEREAAVMVGSVVNNLGR